MTSTDTASSTAAQLRLAPYIFFYGRCEEALGFYKTVFGGSYEVTRNSDTPADVRDHLPPGSENRVMHASFTGPGFSFMCSDGRETKTVNPDEGNVSLGLSATDAQSGRRTFDALAQGGNVTMPLEDAFWGGKFGIVQDRFGVEWFITTP